MLYVQPWCYCRYYPFTETPLVSELSKASKWAWNRRLEKWKKETADNVGEEAITAVLQDMFFIPLREKKVLRDYRLYTKTVSRAEEGTTGADWEWWIQGAENEFVGIRLQAKIAKKVGKAERPGYSELAHKGQYEKLVAEAQNSGVIPAYLFYNGWDAFVDSSTRCVCEANSKRFGISVMSAQRMKKNYDAQKARAKAKQDITLVKHYACDSIPIQCLFSYAVACSELGRTADMCGAILYEMEGTPSSHLKGFDDLPGYVKSMVTQSMHVRQSQSLPEFLDMSDAERDGVAEETKRDGLRFVRSLRTPIEDTDGVPDGLRGVSLMAYEPPMSSFMPSLD